jgi:S1-C subfamily serine protease
MKLLGAATALVLVAGAGAGGAAFAYAHSHDSASAAGIVGGSGSSSPGVTDPNQVPGQTQPQWPQDGNQHRRGRHGDGSTSRFSTPGHASAEQSVGVVDINTNLKYQGARAAGTGMILTSDGEILTNNHVIEGATKIKVTVVSTGKKYVANVVGTDKVDDVAVLQLVGASGLHTVTFDTGTVQVGDAVTAVGNAMGAGGVPSAAEGSVTGLNRSITTQSEGGVDGERLTGLIEVNAMVVAGDSGGPLLDADGQVIGMDTAASSSPMESTGFAIPISKALGIAHQIEAGDEGGNISLGVPAFLGVSFSDFAFGQGGPGAVVAQVLRNTPAARAGIVMGDTITSVDGTTVTSGEQLRTVLSHYEPGQSVTVTWTDTQGGSHTETVKLIPGPAL